MIQVENLTKRYGENLAIDDITFSVNEGEVLGFLGPNGAGKTTTMKILTGFMPPTSGTAKLAGYDVFSQTRRIQERNPKRVQRKAFHRMCTPAYHRRHSVSDEAPFASAAR